MTICHHTLLTVALALIWAYLTILSPVLALAVISLTMHSTQDWRPNSLGYPILILLLRHHTSAIITDCKHIPPRSFLGLTFPGFDLAIMAPKRNEKFVYYGLYMAQPVNMLVSLTLLLWALWSFVRFTLHYIIPLHSAVRRSSGKLTSRG